MYVSMSLTSRKMGLKSLEEDLTKRKIADPSKKFFEALKAARGSLQIQNLGQGFASQVEETESYLKVLLATQSALAVVQSADPKRACDFEEKLGKRSLSMNHIPESVKTSIIGLMKRV